MFEKIVQFKNGKFGLRRWTLFNGYEFWVPPTTKVVKVKSLWVQERHKKDIYEFETPEEITDELEKDKKTIKPTLPEIDLGEEIDYE
ncbi:MAG: hypothetical protein PHG08_01095 [Bacilli bacterium]|nr:hypothetical protein [Bacilli bacterium]